MHNIKLSIIIPFFNAQKFLRQCLLSVLEQDVPLDEYEVIAVNDASTDEGQAVVESLQNKFCNLYLLNIPTNIKQGGARNQALMRAKGDWIWFVDADDYIKPNVLRQLLNRCSDEFDIVHFDYYIERNGVVCPSDNTNYNSIVLPGEQFFNLPSHNWWTTCVNVWQRIMKRSFLIDNCIFFAEKVLYEDVDYSFLCFFKAEKVRHLGMVPYVYRHVNNSSSNSPKTSFLFYYQVSLVQRCIILLKEQSFESQMKNHIEGYIKYLIKESLSLFNTFNVRDKHDAMRLLNKKSLVSILPYVRRRDIVSIIRLWLY